MYRQDFHAQLAEIRDLLAEFRMQVCHIVPARSSVIHPCWHQPTRRCVGTACDTSWITWTMRCCLARRLCTCAGASVCSTNRWSGVGVPAAKHHRSPGVHGRTGVRLYIEPAHRFESNQILTLDDGMRMVREIDEPQLGILLDTGHMHVNGENLAEGVTKTGAVLGHVDLDDNDGSADAHLAPGRRNNRLRALCSRGRRSWLRRLCGVGVGHELRRSIRSPRDHHLAWMRQAFDGC